MATDIIKRIHFSSRTTKQLSDFPFTAETDGILEIQIRSNNTGRCYANFPSLFIVDGYCIGQSYVTNTFAIPKGTIVPLPETSNVLNFVGTYTEIVS